MNEITTIGLDIAKNVFQLHGIDEHGQLVLRKALRRGQLRQFFEKLSPCLIGMEACATAHYWARTLMASGHDVRLIPPAYIKPYLRRQKMGWLPPSPDGIAMCQNGGVKATKRRGRQDERYNDRCGSGKVHFSDPWGFNGGPPEVPQEVVTAPVLAAHGDSGARRGGDGGLCQRPLLGPGNAQAWS